jgi:hypothetical protein
MLGAVAQLSAEISLRIEEGWNFLDPCDGAVIVPEELLTPVK